jgi:hypothetical protein
MVCPGRLPRKAFCMSTSKALHTHPLTIRIDLDSE